VVLSMRPEVFTVVKIQAEVFWTVAPRNVVVGNRVGGPCCLHLHFTLKIISAKSPETLVFYRNTTRRYNPEDLHLKYLLTPSLTHSVVRNII
jgi:hypothetical protein